MALRRRVRYRSRTVIEEEMRVTGSDGITMVPFYMVEGDVARRVMSSLVSRSEWAQESLDKHDSCDAYSHSWVFYRDAAVSYMQGMVHDYYLLTSEVIDYGWESVSAYWD